MVLKEALKEASQSLRLRTMGAIVYDGTNGRRVGKMYLKDGQEVMVYDTKGKHVEDQTGQGFDSIGVKGGGNTLLNLAATSKDPTKLTVA